MTSLVFLPTSLSLGNLIHYFAIVHHRRFKNFSAAKLQNVFRKQDRAGSTVCPERKPEVLPQPRSRRERPEPVDRIAPPQQRSVQH